LPVQVLSVGRMIASLCAVIRTARLVWLALSTVLLGVVSFVGVRYQFERLSIVENADTKS
jgi:hypothetical protein